MKKKITEILRIREVLIFQFFYILLIVNYQLDKMAPSNPLRAPPKPFMRRPRPKPAAGSSSGTNGISGAAVGVKREAVAEVNYKDYPLKACDASDIDAIRTHLLKFQSKNPVDIDTFTKPIRLHRKETRNLQYQLTRAEIEQRQKEYLEEKLRREEDARNGIFREEDEEDDDPDDENHYYDLTNDPSVAPDPVRTEEQKAAARRFRQMVQIAPDGGARKRQAFKRKTRQIKAVKEDIKKLRYEEYYPWVMEDYDGKNTWVGNYEAGNSDNYALLIFDSNGFKLAPVDKVYRFTPRNKYSTLTLEEAEAKMESKKQIPRWLMKHLDEQEQKLTRYERTKKKLKTVQGTRENDKGERDSDNDDLDFEEDFADDEEAPIIDGNEEENKESEAKIKREMRSANIHDEEDNEEEGEDLFGERKVFDKEGEKLRKTLLKTEVGGAYESDDEENPYLNESDIEKEEEEEEIIKADLSKPQTPVQSTMSRQTSPPVNRIRVKSVNKPIGMVVLKSLPSILIKFPKGDWNPNGKKRFIEEDEEVTNKKLKLENPVIKSENNEINIPSEVSNDLLLTEEDILNIVRNERVTAKELIVKLKQKLSQHPENTQRIRQFVKKLLRSDNGYLALK